jgi:Bacterial regulatory proteins, tetR family.
MDNMDLKEKRRMEIIQAAMRVFSKNGFERTKMEAIAAEAGIGKGTIYEYFSSKKQLFEEMIDLNLDKYRENLYKIVKDEQSFYQKLHSLCRYHADFLNQHLDIIRFTSHDGTLLSHSMKNAC